MNLETPRRGSWLIALMLAALLAGCGDGERDDPTDSMSQQREKLLLERVAADPTDVDACLALGNHYYGTNRRDLAITMYRRVLEKRPDDDNVRTDLGTCYFDLGQLDRARQEYERVLAKNPVKLQAIFNLAALSAQTGDYERAVRLWDRVVQLQPDSQEAHAARQFAKGGRKKLAELKAAGTGGGKEAPTEPPKKE